MSLVGSLRSLRSLRALRSIAKVILVDDDTVLEDNCAWVSSDNGLERNRVACADIVTQRRVLQAEVDYIIRA